MPKATYKFVPVGVNLCQIIVSGKVVGVLEVDEIGRQFLVSVPSLTGTHWLARTSLAKPGDHTYLFDAAGDTQGEPT